MSLLLALVCSTLAHGQVVDRIVAVIDDKLVLASEVALESALAPRDASPVPFWRANSSSPDDRLVAAALIQRAAGDLALYQPDDIAVRARLDALRLGFDDIDAWRAFLQRHGLDEDGLLVMLRRRLVVERYLTRNIVASTDNEEVWLASMATLLDKLVSRARVRRVPLASDAERRL